MSISDILYITFFWPCISFCKKPEKKYFLGFSIFREMQKPNYYCYYYLFYLFIFTIDLHFYILRQIFPGH